MPRIFTLQGNIQHYSWGGFEFIPALLSLSNENSQPFAEYWLGAHPNHSATLKESPLLTLKDFIEKDKSTVLGKKVVEQFSSLPYLVKVLDVRQMLSIQAHPDKRSAEIGYEEENRKGIPIRAPHRNYKDDNHKPEMMVALSDFWLLHGFKPFDQIRETVWSVPEFTFLKQEVKEGQYRQLYEQVMKLPQPKVNEVLHPLAQRILPLYKSGSLDKNSADFWAARAMETFCKNGDYDRGIFSVYFFNLVKLKKGDGIYQPAGMPHAYLEGQNVEVMANSDNVLRAGLTDKYIDVDELLKQVKFEPTYPKIIQSSPEGYYPTPAPEFEVWKYTLSNEKKEMETGSAEIWLVMDGSLMLMNSGEKVHLAKGEAAFIVAGIAITATTNESAKLFRVGVQGWKN